MSSAAVKPAIAARPLFQDTSEQALRLRARIDAFNADYANCIDSDRLEEWPAFFTDNGFYRVISRENRDRGLPVSLIYAKGRGMLADRITALRTANIFEPHVYCHLVSGVKIVGQTPANGWKTESNFQVVRTMASGTMSVFACGRYVDTFVEAPDGALLLAERTCVLDSRCIDTLLVVPL